MVKTFDTVVIGGGVMGLWVARHAVNAGLSVALIDKESCGSGASGTVLGALLPHLPRVMSAKKEFQFAALAELPGLIAELEDETGLDAGYARCGRIMPIRTARYLEHAKAACDGAKDGWHSAATGYEIEIQPPGTLGEWIAQDDAPLGLIHDNLSARIMADKYTTALKNSLSRHATLVEGCEVTGMNLTTRRLVSPTGSLDIAGHHVVFAAGYQTFPLVEEILGLELGGGVKGQASLFEIAPQGEARPIIYDNGVYVVPHGPDRCAVGSTSDDTFREPQLLESEKAEIYIERAKVLCPPLRSGRLIRHWAGVRPRCAAKDPIVGCLDEEHGLHIATGGYKISFGIAHRLARHLIEELTGTDCHTVIPDTFAASHHLRSK